MNCVSCEAAMPSGARFCPSCGAPAPSAAAPAARKLVTVLFCDLVGSTELAEGLDPETLRGATLRYFTAMRAQIDRHGGTVEKFIGDAVMAVFGVPVMHEDDAQRAASAALGMLEALAELNSRLEPTLGVRLRVRIGVNTGPAVAGSDYSAGQALVSGDTVNVAARLEQNAAPGEILVGALTRAALGTAMEVESAGPLRLKGKQEPVEAYRLLGFARDRDALAEPETRETLPFVGRETELAHLRSDLDEVRGGLGPRAVTVLGEAGIGKSRLLRAWLEQAGRPLAVGLGRCRSYGEQGSLAPLADALRRVLEGPGAAAAHGLEALAVLEAGLLKDGTPGASPEATRAAVGEVLHAVSREAPVVLAFEDCQWASDPLLDLLDQGLPSVLRGAAVLTVCLARHDLFDRRPGWSGGHRLLVVPALTRADCGTLLDLLADRGVEPRRDRAALLEAAGGNPFHLEQLLAAAQEADDETQLPPNLQALLGARIDALAGEEREALDLAAILGREFEVEYLAALAGEPGTAADSGAVLPALTRLGRRRLVELADPGPRRNDSFRFSSGLVHEATYQAMAKRTRAQRHERAARVLATYPEAEWTAAVGGHLEQAYRYRAELGVTEDADEVLRADAARALAAAGARALLRCDLAWAADLLERALKLFAEGEPGRDATARQLGEARIALGRPEEGWALLRPVLTSADRLQATHAELVLAATGPQAAVDAAATAARAALPVFEAANDGLGLARARIRIAQEQQLLGQHAQAGNLLLEALADAARAAVEPERALALGAVGMSLWRGPEPVGPALARCQALLAEHGGPRPAARLTLSCPTAVLLALDDRFEAARATLTKAQALAASLGFAEGEIVLPMFAAAVEGAAHEPERALELLDQARAAARRLGAGGQVGLIDREAARLLLDAGRVEQAAELIGLPDGSPDGGDRLLRSDAVDLDGLHARLAAAAGDADTARALAGRAVRAAASTDSPVLAAVAATDEAEVLARLGERAKAEASIARARACYEAKGHRPGIRSVDRFHARLEDFEDFTFTADAAEPRPARGARR
ncbi:AAA family ATPase [Actinospica durhamensis]|uniref:AAA family ATPase n=1 Tax=Actinospica durhamensis TaxID=1508375 RepID=A0A941EXF7_9ACTN|nr:adenylate/guanylate cyclase domain-containing protein [Actinospica durhamensis]MBR7839011.1 AAA family ATPase [Actinospica durhamensis]